MMLRTLGILTCLAIALPAQGLTVAAAIVQPLTVQAFGNPSAQQSAPVGPLPAAGAGLAVTTTTSSASLQATPLGSTGFRLQTSGTAFLNFFAAAGWSQGGELLLTLSLPVPTPVVVAIEGTAQAMAASTSTEVDLDNDGNVEATLSASTFQPSAVVAAELGLLVGPGGRSIRIRHTGSGAPTFVSPVTAASDLVLTFYPAAAPLASYGPGCVELTWTRGTAGAVTYSCPAGAGAIVFFAFGLNAQQTPLAIAPGCYQLTDVLALVGALPSGGVASYTQPPLPLPPGFRVIAQAAVFGASGLVQTSQGLAMTGPS